VLLCLRRQSCSPAASLNRSGQSVAESLIGTGWVCNMRALYQSFPSGAVCRALQCRQLGYGAVNTCGFRV